MYIADKLIYLQQPKSGSNHITFILSRLIGGEQLPHHTPISPSIDRTNKLVITSIRDPWDWYISLWSYSHREDTFFRRQLTNAVCETGIESEMASQKISSDTAEGDRQQYWNWIYSDKRKPTLFREWLKALLTTDRVFNLIKPWNHLYPTAGLETSYHLWLCIGEELGHTGVLTREDLLRANEEKSVLNDVIRCESLESDLLRILQKCGYKITEPQILAINNMQRMNPSERVGTIQHYFDKSSIDLVAEKEWFIIDRYGYEAPKI